jgi:hypothetical protein
MKTSIDRIRAKIADLEAKIADLRIAERELEALDAAPAPRTKSKAKAKRKPTTDDATMAPQTVGAAITDVLSRNGALPLAELAEQIRAAGREVSGGTLSNTLQKMKMRGAVTTAAANGCCRRRALGVPAPDGILARLWNMISLDHWNHGINKIRIR